MQTKIDLHVHTLLSPCCGRDNTLNNIVNMSSLLGTQIIAIADHNAVGNVLSGIRIAKDKNILVIPAMEVTTAEEIHLLCFFKDFPSAKLLADVIYDKLPKFWLDEKFYNKQILLDADDNFCGEIGNLLTVASKLGIYELFEIMKDLGGVAVPAHADKDSYSVLSVLGEIPNDLGVTAVEVSNNCPTELRRELEQKYKVITGSDAHDLDSLCVNNCIVELEEVSVDALLKYLKE